ncbi:MAG: hypothetical protein CBD58_01465 [bacterium TMED198]|nr:MAG: hypothetical protein CBD58_01465 [bacterium TMED198]|tara:strand:+ start:2027 stop:2872 length:846 start_codon:yes stop_codon:yes gene_type:complete
MQLSIIIAHFDPGNNIEYKNAFIKTLKSIKSQCQFNDLEVVIADDGSHYSPDYLSSQNTKFYNNEAYHELSQNEFNVILEKYYNDKEIGSTIDRWIILPKKSNKMYKPRILNICANECSSDFIFFLDDDNYFVSNKSVSSIIKLSKQYNIIFGQVIDKNGRARPYSSNRVQGTTFGLNKKIFNNIGGYGEWTIDLSNGVDSDIWWKMFKYFKQNKNIKACYTSEIQTVDTCSKRWSLFTSNFFRKSKLKKAFRKKYQCKNYRNKVYNPSRNKALWIDDLTR